MSDWGGEGASSSTVVRPLGVRSRKKRRLCACQLGQITTGVSPDRETLGNRFRRKAEAKSSLKHQRKTASYLSFCLLCTVFVPLSQSVSRPMHADMGWSGKETGWASAVGHERSGHIKCDIKWWYLSILKDRHILPWLHLVLIVIIHNEVPGFNMLINRSGWFIRKKNHCFIDVFVIPIHAYVKYIWPLITTGLVPTGYLYSFIVIRIFITKVPETGRPLSLTFAVLSTFSSLSWLFFSQFLWFKQYIFLQNVLICFSGTLTHEVKFIDVLEVIS